MTSRRDPVELELQAHLLLAAPRELPHVRLFRRNIIDQHVERNGRRYHLTAGIKGQADLYGYARARAGPAIPLELELKAHDGTQTKEQRAWMTFSTTMGIPFLLLKQQRGETTAATVARWIQEIRDLLRAVETTENSRTPSRPSSTDCPELAPLSAPTFATQNVSSAGTAPTSGTSASGRSGSRGTAPSGPKTRRARSLPLFGRRA